MSDRVGGSYIERLLNSLPKVIVSIQNNKSKYSFLAHVS